MVAPGQRPLLARALPCSCSSGVLRRFPWFRSTGRSIKDLAVFPAHLSSPSASSASSSSPTSSASRPGFLARSPSKPPAHLRHSSLHSKGSQSTDRGRTSLSALHSRSVHRNSSRAFSASLAATARLFPISLDASSTSAVFLLLSGCGRRTRYLLSSCRFFSDQRPNFSFISPVSTSSPLHVVTDTLPTAEFSSKADLSVSLPSLLFSAPFLKHRRLLSVSTFPSNVSALSKHELHSPRSGRRSSHANCLSSVRSGAPRQQTAQGRPCSLNKPRGIRCLSSAAPSSPQAAGGGGAPPRHHAISVPSLGDSIVEGSLLEWRKKVGDAVAVDDVVCVIETDKITVEIHSDCSGILISQAVGEGAVVHIGEQLAVIDSSASTSIPHPPAPASSPKSAVSSSDTKQAAQPQASSSSSVAQQDASRKEGGGDGKTAVGRVHGPNNQHPHHRHSPGLTPRAAKSRVPLICFKFAHRKRLRPDQPHLAPAPLSSPSFPRHRPSSASAGEYRNGLEDSDPVFE